MAEWWTYRPSDFLMFAPRIYWRLFESVNATYWPWQVLIVVSVLLWAWRCAWWWRVSGVVLSIAVALCAWAFLHQRFAPIFWVAEVYAWAFAAQALLLLALVAGRGTDATSVAEPARTRTAAAIARTRVGSALALWTVIGHPLLAPLAGRPWTQAEWPGLAPDATAILVLAWLVRLPDASGSGRALQRAAWVIPVAWCVVSAATLATMGEWQAWVVLVAPLVAVFAMKKGRSGVPLRP